MSSVSTLATQRAGVISMKHKRLKTKRRDVLKVLIASWRKGVGASVKRFYLERGTPVKEDE